MTGLCGGTEFKSRDCYSSQANAAQCMEAAGKYLDSVMDPGLSADSSACARLVCRPLSLLRHTTEPASQICVQPVSVKLFYVHGHLESISSHVSHFLFLCAPTCRCLPCARPSEEPSSRQSRATSGAAPSAQCPTRHPPALTTQTVQRYQRPVSSGLFRIVPNPRADDANPPPSLRISLLFSCLSSRFTISDISFSYMQRC